MSRDPTLRECYRILREARMLTGSTYCLEPDADAARFVLVSLAPDGAGGEYRIYLTEPMSAGDCLGFLRTYIAALEFSDQWRRNEGVSHAAN